MSEIQYNGIIRKIVVAFGNVFNQIQIARFNADGSEAERFLVALILAGKEKYVARLHGDPELNKKVQLGLPIMSYEMTGMEYDPSRKQITNVKTYTQTDAGIKSQYNPVPYNFDFSVYLYVRNYADGIQVMEKILPYFTPDYTIKVNLIPELGVIKEIPLVLKDVSYENDYEGDQDSKTRSIIWTLNFTAKGYLYGPHSTSGLIKTVITNIFDDTNMKSQALVLNVGAGNDNYQEGEIVYQGASHDLTSATAEVVQWIPNLNQVVLRNFYGNFMVNSPITGKTTRNTRTINSYKIEPLHLFQSVITPNPVTANANSLFTYSEVDYEFPNIP